VDNPAVTETDAASPSSHRHAERDNSTLKVRRPSLEVIRTSSTTDASIVRRRPIPADDADWPAHPSPDLLEDGEELRRRADERTVLVVDELTTREVRA